MPMNDGTYVWYICCVCQNHRCSVCGNGYMICARLIERLLITLTPSQRYTTEHTRARRPNTRYNDHDEITPPVRDGYVRRTLQQHMAEHPTRHAIEQLLQCDEWRAATREQQRHALVGWVDDIAANTLFTVMWWRTKHGDTHRYNWIKCCWPPTLLLLSMLHEYITPIPSVAISSLRNRGSGRPELLSLWHYIIEAMSKPHHQLLRDTDYFTILATLITYDVPWQLDGYRTFGCASLLEHCLQSRTHDTIIEWLCAAGMYVVMM